MATEAEHIAAANRTQETIGYLLPNRAVTSPWIAIAAFYKALHVVEAVFANDRAIGHTSDHGERERRLKTIRKYENIAKHYLPLYRASLVARYLTPHSDFDAYLSPDQVVSVLLKHRLRQVENSAQRFLSDPARLGSILDCANLPS